MLYSCKGTLGVVLHSDVGQVPSHSHRMQPRAVLHCDVGPALPIATGCRHVQSFKTESDLFCTLLWSSHQAQSIPDQTLVKFQQTKLYQKKQQQKSWSLFCVSQVLWGEFGKHWEQRKNMNKIYCMKKIKPINITKKSEGSKTVIGTVKVQSLNSLSLTHISVESLTSLNYKRKKDPQALFQT